MKNTYHTIEDFLLDPYFLEWVNHNNPEVNAFWQGWLQQNPEKKELLTTARRMALDLSTHGKQLSQTDKNQIWNNLQALRHSETIIPTSNTKEARQISLFSWFSTGQVAASLAAFLMAALLGIWFLNRPGTFTEYKTAYGQIKKVTLPDGSQVVLNGNSSISYPEKWDNDNRNVSLTGEAFFQVIHTKQHQKFKVVLTRNLKVEVLGTSFTATSRPTKKRVVLSEGKVKMAFTNLASGNAKPSVSATTETTLQPGDLVELSGQKEIFRKLHVSNPTAYAAFQEQKLVFEEAPLSEIARVLKDNYGYQVTFAQPNFASKKFTGSIPSNRIDLLLAAFEKLYHLKVVRKGKSIYIQ